MSHPSPKSTQDICEYIVSLFVGIYCLLSRILVTDQINFLQTLMQQLAPQQHLVWDGVATQYIVKQWHISWCLTDVSFKQSVFICNGNQDMSLFCICDLQHEGWSEGVAQPKYMVSLCWVINRGYGQSPASRNSMGCTWIWRGLTKCATTHLRPCTHNRLKKNQLSMIAFNCSPNDLIVKLHKWTSGFDVYIERSWISEVIYCQSSC